jgi:hypothetical protein
MLQGLAALAEDAMTGIIVLVSKPPAPTVAARIRSAAGKVGKPVVIAFLGATAGSNVSTNVHEAETLEHAALTAVALARGDSQISLAAPLEPDFVGRTASYAPTGRSRKYVRGLFGGGTLCYEAQLLLRKALGSVRSNAPIEPGMGLPDPWTSIAHTLIDMGTETFTRGRPHPMIDQRLRLERIVKEAGDSETAVILFDVVLGYGAHPDPGSEIAATIDTIKRQSNTEESGVAYVASICGTRPTLRIRQSSETLWSGSGCWSRKPTLPRRAWPAESPEQAATRSDDERITREPPGRPESGHKEFRRINCGSRRDGHGYRLAASGRR